MRKRQWKKTTNRLRAQAKPIGVGMSGGFTGLLLAHDSVNDVLFPVGQRVRCKDDVMPIIPAPKYQTHGVARAQFRTSVFNA